MCGIFALLNNRKTFTINDINNANHKGQRRGPEETKLEIISNDLLFGFHRLAINGLDTSSGQPMQIDGITLICNGEIYNYKELFEEIKVKPTTHSDCEIIIHLYKLYGIEQTLRMLDGVFSFVLYDNCLNSLHPQLHVARDPFGVRPLYYLSIDTDYNNDSSFRNENFNITNENIIAFASEVKVLSPLLNYKNKLLAEKSNYEVTPFTSHPEYYTYSIKQFIPGTYSTYSKDVKINSKWRNISNNRYHSMICKPSTILKNNEDDIFSHALSDIYTYLNSAVKKRVVGTTDRPIACLLSGGLDSSLITALVNKYYPGTLETYSIGMEGSEDLKNAKKVAEHLNTKHTEIVLTKEQFFNSIPEVIENIESYDTTTVRASVGNYLIGKYIAENSDAKVIFNGDGSDELTGGYIYFLACPNNIEFDKECRRLLSNIYTFDVLRSDKSISSNGLEPRTPFLDRDWVEFYLSLPVSIRNPLNYPEKSKNIEKYLLRQAFHTLAPELLPTEVLWRTKEAFSDGVSGNSGTWFEIINEKVEGMYQYFDNKPTINHYNINPPTTSEQIYYRDTFNKYYPNCYNVLPYFWMPNYVNATDSSARTISFYKNTQNKENKEIFLEE
jgi:asparagine synthase (glutamine-hydrolysing)